ncbi:MAG: hypothetical protein QOF48_2294 [Verrucomicrobiota bacterium]|jgi:hypothetical protein
MCSRIGSGVFEKNGLQEFLWRGHMALNLKLGSRLPGGSLNARTASGFYAPSRSCKEILRPRNSPEQIKARRNPRTSPRSVSLVISNA